MLLFQTLLFLSVLSSESLIDFDCAVQSMMIIVSLYFIIQPCHSFDVHWYFGAKILPPLVCHIVAQMVKSEKKSFPSSSSSFFFKHSFPEKGSFWCQIEFTKMKFILFRSPGEIGYLSWLSFKSVFGIILQLLFNWIRIRGKCSHWAKLHHYLAS